MNESRGLEGLSNELFNAIVTYLPQPRIRSALSQVSRLLRNKIAPHLYSSWQYYGPRRHSFKSLLCFLRTMILHQDLASHVLTLDLRQWNHHNRRDVADATYKNDIESFQGVIHSLGLSPDRRAHYEDSVRHRNDDVLLALLLTQLPNIESVYMTLPGESQYTSELLDVLSHAESAGILKRVDSLYLCSGLHMGVKGHREYDIDLEAVLPFFQLKNLRSLFTLTLSPVSEYSRKKQEPFGVPQSSNISELAFDDAELDLDDILKVLALPKALTTFRWIQKMFNCGPIGLCIGPVFRDLGEALAIHKDTLEHLHLGIRYRHCNQIGHAGNPNVNEDDMLRSFRLKRKSNAHLIGSLREFTALKMITIDPAALCGDQIWGISPYKMAEGLPPSLEVLHLYFGFERLMPTEDQVWVEQLVELVQASGTQLRRLQEIALMIVDRSCYETEDLYRFRPVEEACHHARISFRVRQLDHWDLYHKTRSPIPYFQERSAKRNPGRDY
jgi:hypothetical protein